MKHLPLRPAALALIFLSGCSAVTNSGATSGGTTITTTAPSTSIPSLQQYPDAAGTMATYASSGSIDESNHFFVPLGTNGRTCATCHQLNQGMSISAASAAALFASTLGADPLFAAVDGANCPTAATGDAAAHSLMISKGLIRVAVPLPAAAQFKITVVSDPYGCAIATSGTQQTVSVYRRPLPSTAVAYLSNVMWDTRETISPLSSSATFSASLNADLTQQLLDAVSTHMQGTATPNAAQIAEILPLQQGIYTAQETDAQAGSLSTAGGKGGAANLAGVLFYPGVNDAFGGDPTGAVFDPAVFTLYAPWINSNNARQASINRGEGVFNKAPMNIEGVSGINDNAALGSPKVFHGTCGTCHDTPNVGSHSLPLPLDTGTGHIGSADTDPNVIAGLAALTTPSLPVYQITGCKNAAGAAVTYTTKDPGKALVTGLCTDVNRTKVPSLRGLAARAPYFHAGAADNLQQLVAFYNVRFTMGLNTAQQADLVNFLNAL